MNEAETQRIAAMRQDLSDLDDTIREYREDLGGSRKLLYQLGHPSLLLAAKPVYRLCVVFGRMRLGVSRIVLTQKKCAVSMNSFLYPNR